MKVQLLASALLLISASSVFATCDLAKPYLTAIKPESFRPIANCTKVIDGEFTPVERSDRGPTANIKIGCVFEGQFNGGAEIRGLSVVGTDANGWDSVLQYGLGFTATNKVQGYRENAKEIVMFNKAKDQTFNNPDYKTDFDDRFVYNKKKQELTVLLRLRNIYRGVPEEWKTVTAIKLGCSKI